MLLRPGVNFEPHPKLLYALRKLDLIFNTNGEMFIITSLKDREHSPGSLHYVGMAVDVRIHHIKDGLKRQEIYQQIHDVLDERYDIIHHSTHMHIEVKTT